MINVKYPCRNCKYFKTCGDRARVTPCQGRETNKKNGGFKNGEHKKIIK